MWRNDDYLNSYCIYLDREDGSFQCSSDECLGDECPYRYSREDYEDDKADILYEIRRDCY